MDAGKYYALLRFEEASCALRAALKLEIVDRIGSREVSMNDFREMFDFTVQGARTFAALLEVMEVISRKGDRISIPERAKSCLPKDIPSTRRPYLAMGSSDDADILIAQLQGRFSADSLPLYGGDEVEQTVMDLPDVGREIALGLASRARNFAEPLAKVLQPLSGKARIVADIGAGSPYVALACLKASPHLAKAVVVDRANAMPFLRELANESQSADDSQAYIEKLEFQEQDFFKTVPPADIYCLSNTAHDWLPDEYSQIVMNIRDAIAPGGVVCIHEPLLSSTWNSADEWVQALWMACYAITLYRLTEGKGTCYTQKEHDWVMAQHGFAPIGEPEKTADGCTALLYRLGGADREHSPSSAPQPM